MSKDDEGYLEENEDDDENDEDCEDETFVERDEAD